MDAQSEIAAYYDRASLVDRLKTGLSASGLGEGRLSTKQLAALDQFHSRGLEATVELASALSLQPNTDVIDIGSGLGGPSRYLAETYGCRVRGVDLSSSFVEAATYLAERCGLSDKVAYQTGDALSLPFADASCDLAWTQHVAMNIADRARLYAEAFRALRPGGRLAIYDVVAGSGAPVHFPVPWATTPNASFLVTGEAMRAFLTGAGFQVISWIDRTAEGAAWFLARENAPRPALGLSLAMGPEFETAAANLRRNLVEGRVGLAQVIADKP
jgi:SAM-dependent methyltransferase